MTFITARSVKKRYYYFRKRAEGGGFMKCPGQDMRNLRVSVHKCPNCGAEVEIFSDEMRVRCPKCRQMVYKEKVPSCIDWCASARQCLGEERWRQLMGEE
jgi:DNA-directed RNA polymerase subunit RPC12/RpoP